MKEEPLSQEFVHACFKEMSGTQMMDTAIHDKPNMGPAYRVSNNDKTAEVLAESAFVKTLVNNCTAMFSNQNVPVSLKIEFLVTALVASVKFGLYLQRRVNERGGMIL